MLRYRKTIILYLSLAFAIFLTSCGQKGANDFYKDGLKCMNGGSYEEAANYFSMAIQKNGERAEYHVARGMALVECGEYEEAVDSFDAAIREKDNRIIRENNKHAHRGKGIAYLREGKYEKADKQFEKALAIQELPDLNEDIMGYQVEVKLGLGDLEGALKGYDQLIGKSAKTAQYFMGRALVKTRMEDAQGALLDYDESVRLNARNYGGRLAKYLLQKDLGDTQGAQQTLEEVLELKPKDMGEELHLAAAKYYRGDGEALVEELERLAQAGVSEAYYYRGLIDKDKGDDQNALEHFMAYYEKGGGLGDLNFGNQVIECYIALAQYDKALEWVGKWTGGEKTESRRDLYANEIILYERLGDFDAAYAKANEYKESYPDDKEMEKELAFITTRISGKLKKELKKAEEAKATQEPEQE